MGRVFASDPETGVQSQVKRNQLLNHIEFLLTLTVTILCQKQHAEIGLNVLKIIILIG